VVVVVHGAAGGVGLLLTQLAKCRGGIVVATTSTNEKADLARQAGADHLAGYEDFAAVAKQASGGAGAAVVFDGVGKATFDQSLAALRPRGYMVLYGAASGPVPPLDLQRLAGGRPSCSSPARPWPTTSPSARSCCTARATCSRGSARASSSCASARTYPLEDAARAQEDLSARRTTGKLLLLPG
jgi:NADPH2:quinone reductase